MFRQQPSKNAQPLKQSTDKLLALMVLSAMKPCADVSASLDTQQLPQEKQNVPKFLLDNLNGAKRLEDVPHVKFHLSMLQLIPTAKSTAVSENKNCKGDPRLSFFVKRIRAFATSHVQLAVFSMARKAKPEQN